MKTFAHRGWSEGTVENTIPAFKKSLEAGFDGVEFDIRYGKDGQTIILSHNPVENATVPTLEEALLFLQATHFELLIECKEYSEGFYQQLVQLLEKYQMVERATIFAFPRIAKQFPWEARGLIKLGIITPYPYQLNPYIKKYQPDMVLLGWGTTKERFLFKMIWSLCSLPRFFAKYPALKFVIGTAFTEKDKTWLAKQTGLYCFTADMPL